MIADKELHLWAHKLYLRAISLKQKDREGLAECFNEFKAICIKDCENNNRDVESVWGKIFHIFNERFQATNLNSATFIITTQLARMLGLGERNNYS